MMLPHSQNSIINLVSAMLLLLIGRMAKTMKLKFYENIISLSLPFMFLLSRAERQGPV